MANHKCFLCGRWGADARHHAFGGANRKLSEKYGAWVWLHNRPCHIQSPIAVHNNKENNMKVKRYCQRKVMEEQGWTIADFRKVFVKNYLDEVEE